MSYNNSFWDTIGGEEFRERLLHSLNTRPQQYTLEVKGNDALVEAIKEQVDNAGNRYIGHFQKGNVLNQNSAEIEYLVVFEKYTYIR